ncbi:mandelate racemase/muconate lactonizing enzyme family protein [Rhodopila sp.]|jgi:L-alanine-DL-glutamate epimerase-like enolase superfamily enzyme|uniref:mandelate racemase/muconate lactonizing enzyme family protein n=1 Tax=Rhodopila sp. TaxID=2480087 RepID=UPI002CFC4336|nr:mandelate racemase/muconate lactonizing enzyme family protein [Rhodopila sp.]HVZ06998.1 mandelate racemase/muconate lactonizing enzyme family protein [Rhodopila sp.]
MSHPLKIARVEDLHCDAGWRTFSFLKITTQDGLTGWSEYTEADGSRGLTAVIQGMAEQLIGQDARAVQAIDSFLYVKQVQAPNGVNQRAIAAIGNALLDLKGKALGVPVHELFGGPVRDRIPVYWSHCGTYRVRNHEAVGSKPLRTFDDVAALGAEVKAKGFKALKTNILPFDGEKLTSFGPGFGRSPGWPALNCDRATLASLKKQLTAFREGAGPDMGLHLDINYHFKTEGNIQVAKAAEPFDLTWLEIDNWDPAALALIRSKAPCPIASLESVTGRRAFRPFLDAYAADVAIIDVIWNGFLESIKIAAMAEAYEVNVAPHNYYGHLCSAISAHFCAVVPNFRVMEIDIDSVSWRDELFINAPRIENGELLIPTGPGWGVEVNEAAVRAHPPKG